MLRRSEGCGVTLRADVANPATEVPLEKNPNAMLAVLWAGFACGVLDITAALIVYGYFGAKPVPLLQGIPRWTSNGAAWPSLSLRHRIWRGYCLFCGQPRYSFLDTERGPFWRAVWRGRLFLHEPHCAAALRCRQASVFHEVDDRRRGHTHLLCRTSYISYRAPIFLMIGAPRSTLRCVRSM